MDNERYTLKFDEALRQLEKFEKSFKHLKWRIFFYRLMKVMAVFCVIVAVTMAGLFLLTGPLLAWAWFCVIFVVIMPSVFFQDLAIDKEHMMEEVRNYNVQLRAANEAAIWDRSGYDGHPVTGEQKELLNKAKVRFGYIQFK